MKCGGEELLAKCELEGEIGGVEVRKTFVDEPLLDERFVVTLKTRTHTLTSTSDTVVENENATCSKNWPRNDRSGI